MKNIQRKSWVLIVLSLLWAISGCAFFDDSEDKKPAEDLSIHSVGDAVAAVPYSEAQTITLFIKDETGGSSSDVSLGNGFKVLKNGDYVEAGSHTLGVTVTPRIVNGSAMSQRVAVSDGGWNYQVDAMFDDTTGYYLCEFEFMGTGTYIVHPVLVQVFYPDGKASKEKLVVTTYKQLRPEADKLVWQGIGVSMSSQVITGIKDSITPLIKESMPSLVIRELKPVQNTDTDNEGILHLDLKYGVVPVSMDLALKDTYTDKNGKEIRALTMGISNLSGGSSSTLLDGFINMVITFFSKKLGMGEKLIDWFNLDEIPIMPVSFPLADMLSGLTGQGDTGSETAAESDPMAGLLKNLELDSTLFLNMFGLPDMTDGKFAVIGGSLWATGPSALKTDVKGNALWPAIQIDNTDPRMDLERIKTQETGIGIAMSQFNLNQMLCEMMRGFRLTMPGVQEYLPFISPENPENALDLILTANPAGIAIDLESINPNAESARLDIRDIRGVLVEAGVPKTEISLDLCMDLDVFITKRDGAAFLDMTLVPVEELSYIHVLKDALNATIYDHSPLISLIISGITGSDGEAISFSIPLSDMGLKTKDVGDAGNIDYDGNGNCFLNLAVDSIDFSGMGGCFIETANLWE